MNLTNWLNNKYSNNPEKLGLPAGSRVEFLDNEKNLIPQYQDYRTVMVDGVKMIYVYDEDNAEVLSVEDFNKYRARVEQSLRQPFKIELTEDEIDRIEAILQHGI